MFTVPLLQVKTRVGVQLVRLMCLLALHDFVVPSVRRWN